MIKRSLLILAAGIGLLIPSVVSATPFLFEADVLTPSDEPDPATNGFGSSIDVDGQYLAIGASGDAIEDTGAVYVFKQTGNNWIEQTKLTGSGTTIENELGRSVAIDGEWIVAGAPRLVSDFSPGGGQVYLFRRTGETWSEHSQILSPNPLDDLGFGISVDISGNVMVASSEGFDTAPGRAYVYRFNGTDWLEETTLFAIEVGGNSSTIGGSVAIDNNVIIASSTGDDGKGETIGVVDVFRYDGLNWIEETKLTAIDQSSNVTMGSSLSMDGNYFVAGAISNDHAGTRSGAAFVFHYDGLSWSLLDKLTASDASTEDQFGRSVDIYGNNIVAGAPFHNHECAENAHCDFGMAYLFHRSGNQWIERNKLSSTNPVLGEFLGNDVTLNEEFLFSSPSNFGRVNVYPAPVAIPTLSSWGVMILLLLLVIAGTIYLRKHARLLACFCVCIVPAIAIA